MADGMYDEPKMHPSFRQEDQEMAEQLKPVIVGPPAYSSPDPETNAGALVPVEQHPFNLDADYGKDVPDAVPGEPSTLTIDSGTADREEWTKEQWQDQAEKLGVAKSGNKDEVRARVEEAEANPVEDDDEDNG